MMTTMQESHIVSSTEQLVNEVEDNKLRICFWTESPMAEHMLVSYFHSLIIQFLDYSRSRL